MCRFGGCPTTVRKEILAFSHLDRLVGGKYSESLACPARRPSYEPGWTDDRASPKPIDSTRLLPP